MTMSDAASRAVVTESEMRRLDAEYKGFPRFAEWTKLPVDETRWKHYTAEHVQLRETTSPDILERARRIVRRAAAVDTGALENLYDVEAGFTFTVAKETADWQAALDEKGEEVRGLIEAQLDAYECILNLSTEATPVSEAAIRELHNVICKNQQTYPVHTPVGVQKIELPKGMYKANPNHVRTRDGKLHVFAPVDLTPEEMHRFCEELRSAEFQAAHPILQAAYAHYAFILIHPFADGNGRVARALASVYTYRAVSAPVLILAEKRDEYLRSLAASDSGNVQRFVDFIRERTIDSIQLVDESIKAADTTPLETSLEVLDSLNRTQGGYTHEQVEKAGAELLKVFQDVLKREFGKAVKGRESQIEPTFALKGAQHGTLTGRFQAYKAARSNSLFIAGFKTKSLPRNVQTRASYHVIIPIDSDKEDELYIVEMATAREIKQEPVFSVRASEMIPQTAGSTLMLLTIVGERLAKELLSQLAELAQIQKKF